MTSPLNSPLEVGVRVLMLLSEAFPAHLDLNRLVLLDHGLLHSADLGGPESLYPPLPIRSGELGVKRRTIEAGLQVMIRAGLAQMDVGDDGIRFRANEDAEGFVNLLGTNYANALHDRASWVVGHFGTLEETALRQGMRDISAHWSEEFEQRDTSEGAGF
jgi:hypothetical protein